MIESSIADLLNCATSPYGGAIIAALFLEKFVSPQVDWVHFDMMAWNQTTKPGRVEGGEAMALRTVARYLEKRFL